MWVASKLSGKGALGADLMELRNWILHFGCASEKLRVIVARLANWMATSPPPPPLGRRLRTYGMLSSCTQ